MVRNYLLSWATSNRLFRLWTHRNHISSGGVSDLFPSRYGISRNYHTSLFKRLCAKNVPCGLTLLVKRFKTTAIFNACKDDDGNDMSIEITKRASNRLKEIMIGNSNPNLALRVKVESGGCHGFQYLMSLITLPKKFSGATFAHEGQNPLLSGSSDHSQETPPQNFISSHLIDTDKEKIEKTSLSEDDTVFLADDGSGVKVVMNKSSLEILKGSKIDYTMELIGSQFKIVDNPSIISSCGCGTSFDIK